MALLFLDGFDAGDNTIKWDTATGTTSTTTRFSSGRSLSLAANVQIRKNFTASAQITVGFAVMISASNTWYFALYSDSGATQHLTINRNASTGRIQLHLGTGLGTVLATGTKSLFLNEWNYIEMQAAIDDAVGTVQIRINGDTTPDIDFTGDTRNGGASTNIDSMLFQGGATTYVDDLYLLNSTGTSNTTFLGDIRVHSLSPNGNGNSSLLVGSDANSVDNYLLVDELPYDSADYAGSATTTDKDTYTVSDMPANTNTVYGVQNVMIAAKSDATAASARTVLRAGGTDYGGTTQALATSYDTYTDVYDVNPNTTVAWTPADVNGLESGMEVM